MPTAWMRVEQDRHRPVRLIEQKLAEPGLVEIAADKAQPQRIEDGQGAPGRRRSR